MNKVYLPREIEKMRQSLKEKYGPFSSKEFGLDYDHMKQKQIIENYESMLNSEKEYLMNESGWVKI